jgi:hypothetical protein
MMWAAGSRSTTTYYSLCKLGQVLVAAGSCRHPIASYSLPSAAMVSPREREPRLVREPRS